MPCMCGNTECRSCGLAQGYKEPSEWDMDRNIIEAATPRPWEASRMLKSGEALIRMGGEEGQGMRQVQVRAVDAVFIAAARTRWPVALDWIAELERERDELRTLLREVLDAEDNGDFVATTLRPATINLLDRAVKAVEVKP